MLTSYLLAVPALRHKWAVKDSNLRSLLTTDLQSVPFGHLGNRPGIMFLTAHNSQQFACRADDENRTRNRPLTRRVLCRLSYVGTHFAQLSRGIIPKPYLKGKSISAFSAMTRRVTGN